ncbi:Uncharacterized protein APZ42_003721 [Daphnia magna]|uniref:Uncharacterized protein n=1 Tax=Daphnia magna TaxID=35525 RepID=A0A168EJS3_9CRUS|nr:Uncharacterized protein APZ42_003721 [Daphnia magna]
MISYRLWAQVATRYPRHRQNELHPQGRIPHRQVRWNEFFTIEIGTLCFAGTERSHWSDHWSPHPTRTGTDCHHILH